MLIAGFVVALSAAAVAIWSATSAHRSAQVARDALLVQQRSFELTHRPYIAITRTIGDMVPPGQSSISFLPVITNAGNVPGRITSHRTTYIDDANGVVETIPSPTEQDIVYPNEEIQAGLTTQRGRRVIDRIEYEDLEGRRQYWFEIEYSVLGFPPAIMRKEAN